MNVQQKTKGFTIIEVVLVLAIAALIFLLVFLALPALQRNQRDTQRRTDVGRVIGAIQSYMSNTQGTVPSRTIANSTIIPNYLKANGSTFTDPSSGDYDFAATEDNLPPITGSPSMGYVVSAICGSGTATANNVKVTVQLEGGGTYCANN